MTSYTSGASGAYNITITFNGTWTSSLQGVFKAAADRLSDLITGDVPDVRVNGKIIDDINIYPAHATIRKFVGSMTRKLSVTSSQ